MHVLRFTPLIPFVVVCAGLGGCGGDSLVLPKDAVPAAIAIIGGDHQAATIGALLPESLVVRVTDASGRPVEGQSVTFTVTGGGGSVAPATSATNADGRAGSRWTLGTSAGAQTVQAKVTGTGAPANLVANFAATAGSATATTIAMVRGDAQTGTAGSSLTDSLVVLVTDASSNPVAGVGVSWTLTGGGTVSAAATTTGPDGRTGVQRTLGTIAGAQTTIAAVTGLTGSPITFQATATVGSAGQLLMATQPSASAASAAALAQPPVIQLADGGGNPVATAGIAVSVSLATTPGPGASLVGGATTVPTNAQGRATFTGLGISGPAGAYTLNFTGTNLTGVTSASVTLTAGAAVRLVFTGQPGNAGAGVTIAPPVTVTVQDALGNTVTGSTASVTLALANNPGGATLGGTRTVSAVNGVATFNGLSVNLTGSGYSLGASSAGLTGATSNPFNIATGAATTIAVNGGNGQSATAGSAVVVAPSVKVTDASNNGVAGVSVTFSVTGGGGSISGASQATDAQGIAAVGSWTLGPAAGPNGLNAAAAGLSGSPVAFTATGVAGSAGKLAIAVQPSASASSGVALVQQPQLQLQDVNGNPVNTAGQSVTAQVASGPSGATLTNATATTNGSGLAVFSGLAITGPSGTYALSFGGVSLTGVTSTGIVVGSGSATRLSVTTPPSATVPNATTLAQQPVVQLEDATGNAVGQAGVTVTAALQQGGANLTGTTSVATNSAGVATFGTLGITGTVGNYTLLFNSPSLASTSAGPVSVTAGAVSATQSGMTATTPIAAGSGTSTVTVTARDVSGNAIAGASVTPSGTPTGGSFTPASGTTDASGVALFSYSNTASGTKTMHASIASTTITPTAPVVVQAGAADPAISTISVSPSTIPADGTTAATITVTALDQYNNLVSGVAVTFSVTGTNTVTPASATTNASGVATAAVTSTSSGLKTVTATVAGQTISSGAPALAVTALGPSSATSSVTLTPASTAAGTAVTVDVLVRDANNNALSGASVTMSSNAAGSFGSTSLTTNASGQASTTFTPTASGTHTITAQISSIQKTATLTVAAGTATTIALSGGNGQSATAGSAVATAPSVTVTDANGNGVSGVSVTFSVTGGGGSVTGASQNTNAQGVAAVGSWTLGTAAGANTLSAVSTGLTGSPVGFTATGTVGSAGKLAITTQPSSAASSGVAFVQQPQLQLQDVNGNPVSTPGQSVTAQIASGPGGATLSNSTATTNASGLATFAGLAISGPSGAYTLSFGGTSLTGVTSGTITIGSGSATKLVLTTQPSSTVANGTALAQQPVVQLEDATGNAVGQAGVTVTAALQQGGANLTGTTSVATNSAGVATFGMLGITGAVGNYTLLFSAPSLTSTQSAGATSVTPGAVSASLSTLTAATPIVAGTGSSTVTVTALDGSSNPIPGATVTPSVTPAGGTFTPTSGGTTDASGVATFTYSNTIAGNKTIQAAIASTTITQTRIVVVQAGPVDPAVSILAVSPSSIPADGTTAATITVTAEDQFGNAVSGVTVGFSVTGTNTVTPASAVSNASGVATATVTSTQSGIKTVTGTVNAAAISSGAPTLTVTAGGPSVANSQVTVTPTGTTAGTAVTVDVLAKDANGNVLSGATVALSSNASGSFANPSLTTNASGQASTTFTPTAAATHTIAAQITFGTSIQKTTTLTVSPDVVSLTQSALVVGPPTSFTAGGAGTSVTVTAEDQYGNPVAGAPVVVSVTGTNSVGAAGSTNASGQATATVTSTEAGMKTVTATINGSTIGASGSVTVNPDVPDAGTSTVTANPVSIPAGSNSTITVTVLDRFGNAVPGVVPTFTEVASPGPGTGTFTAAAATDATGTTTSAFSSTDSGQTFTVTVTARGVTITQTANVTIL